MKVLVTGGGGYLGRHLAMRLLREGHEVAVFGRRDYPFLPESIEQIQGDLRSLESLRRACRGREAVFHVAALTGIWGPRLEFESVNLTGTHHLIQACQEQNVPRLIYTSSPSVVFGEASLEGADESTPYPEDYLCDYPRTKAAAERLVLEAHGRQGVQTAALRPHLIWGPGDPHLIPRIIQRARRGRLVQVGDGRNRVDITYIDNAVEGHLRALEALEGAGPAGGRVYFLSDGEPVVLWDWINRLLRALELPPVRRSISYPAGRALGGVLEAVYRFLGLSAEPPMTRFLAGQLAHSHYFDIGAARRDLQYQPVVSPEAAWQRTIEWFKSHPVD